MSIRRPIASSSQDEPDGPEPRRPRFREHPLESFLRIFGDVRPTETTTVLLLMLNVFLVLTAYYLLKVAREPLILLGAGGGAEVKSYASVGQSIALVFVTSAYAWLSARVRRLTLIVAVSTFFASNLAVFALLGLQGVALGVPFYLWLGVFNVTTVAQFWSFAADLYTEEEGKRLFPVIGIGTSVGAVAGASIASQLYRIGPFALMLLAATILVASLALTYLVHRREMARPARVQDKERDQPLEKGNGFALILRDRYLLFFAALVLVLNFSTKTGDYLLDRMLLDAAPAQARELGVSTSAYIAHFKAGYFAWINVVGIALQLVVVSRVIKYVGVRWTLVLMPVAALTGYTAVLVAPILVMLKAARITEDALDYSLSNTVRQALWLVTSRESKYKAKQVIDTFIMRAGDVMSAGLVWYGSRAALSTRGFISFNIGFDLLWLALALLIGREYLRRSATETATKARTSAAGLANDPGAGS